MDVIFLAGRITAQKKALYVENENKIYFPFINFLKKIKDLKRQLLQIREVLEDCQTQIK